jgi:phage shock protein A
MINGEAILAAVLSLRDATERSFKRLEEEVAGVARRLEKVERRLDALETRIDRFEVKVLQRFDSLDARLTAVEQR